MKSFLNVFSDLLSIFKGIYVKKKNPKYIFAFIVHSRSYKDIFRKYPFVKYFPKNLTLLLMKHLWPVTLSTVTGVKAQDGTDIKGYVLGITMTAEQMMNDREYALQKIRQTLLLAKGKGAHIVGLGGLTSSLSGGGRLLIDIKDINITTGHAYTAYNITQNLFALTERIRIPRSRIKVAVVGAAGSVGSSCALLLARAGYLHIVIIDLERKKENLIELEKELKKYNPDNTIIISFQIQDISDCDFVITATNTPEALVTVDLVRAGMIIIDDAQPSDIHPDVLLLEHVLVLEAGVVHTPGIKSNFNYGLKHKTDNFCCMAELLILASHQWDSHYVIHRATIENIDTIADMGKELGFTIASFQNFLESVPQKKIKHVTSLIRTKYADKT